MKNKKYETILEMDDRQWEEFRNTKWLAYKAEVEKHTLPPPDWYMQSKEDYVEFLETKDLSKITVPKKQTSSFKEIIKNIMKSDDTLLKQWAVEDFSKEDGESFRKEKWLQAIEEHKDSLVKKLGKEPEENKIPYGFLKDQKKYAGAIQEYENLKNQVSILETEISTKKGDLVGFVTQRADEKMAKINNEVFGFDSPSLRKSEKAEIKTEAFRDNGHYATEDAVIKEILKQK